MNEEQSNRQKLKKPPNLIGLFLIFVVPFAIILYLFVSEVNLTINFASKERLGIQYNHALRDLLQDLLDYPDTPYTFLGGPDPFEKKVAAKLAEIDPKDIGAIDTMDQKLGIPLETTEKWVELKVRLLELKSHADRLRSDEIPAAAASTVSLIGHVGDTSNLILDPDLDTYYLMDAMVTNLPALSGSIAQARALATGLAERKSMTDEEKRQLITTSGLIRSAMDSVGRGLRVAFRFNQTLKSELEAYTQTFNTTNQFLELLDKDFVNARQIETPPEQVYASGAKTMDAHFRLYDIFSSRLDRLLTARITRSSEKKYLVEAFGFLALVVAGYVFIGFGRTLEQRISAVEALREAEARYRSIFDNAAHGIFQMSPEGRYISANPALAKIFGLGSPEEFMAEANRGLSQFYVDPKRPVEFLRLLLEQRSVADFESQIRRKAGRRIYRGVAFGNEGNNAVIWISETAHTIRDTAGKIRSIEGTVEDITQRRAAEQARQEVERMKDEFVSVVSHELRTPLTSIRGALGLLAGGRVTDPEKSQRMLNIAVTNTDRLVRLINNILDIERMESGRISMEKVDCGVAALMTSAADAMQGAAEKANVKLSVSPLQAHLFADPDRIMQTLTNLLSNAIKFSPPGGTIWLTAVRVDGQIQFQVRDEGRGIPADKLTSIFERFQQVDSSDAREKGGTGLGLAICQSIVTQHGGRIWVESKLGEGSTFFVALEERKGIKEEKPETPAITVPPAMQKVLVCDDDASVRSVLQTMLEQRGYQVICASSGQEAVEQATAQRPNVVLLDLVMPGMDGWQTMAALKQGPDTRDIPIIIVSVLSAQETESSQAESSQAEIAGWVRKPLDETALTRALERTIGTPARAPRVLLVEDDPALARVVMTMFEEHGIQVIHAQSGREAIEASQNANPDLLILDVGLPEGDGFDVVKWLRQQDRMARVPLVIYTAKDLDASDRERLTLGVTEFLTKCRVSPEEFERRVIRLLHHVMPEIGAPVRATPGNATKS